MDMRATIGVMPPPDSRAVLAANLLRMIDATSHAGDRKPSIRAWALDRGLDVRMIDRLTKRQHAITLDKLQEIADACGLQPWQLLIEDLDPGNPPEANVTAEDRAMLARLRTLLST
jgi:hypothetical protein